MKSKRNLMMVLIGIVFGACPAIGQTPSGTGSPISYALRFGSPNTHLLDITIRAAVTAPSAEFSMPAWAPGAYQINDYAKMVQEFSASDADGHSLPWRKTDKQTWRVSVTASGEISVRYKLFGNTLADNWVQYNDTHAHISGPAVWMYLVGGKTRPVRLSIDVPNGWRAATGMTRGADGNYAAADYDWFIDSPLEIGDFAESSFDTAGATFHLIVHDLGGKKDFAKFTADSRKFVEALARVIPAADGTLRAPFKDYYFFYHLAQAGNGGLEHLNSTQIVFSTDWDDAGSAAFAGRLGDSYDLKLFVAAHEFFHAWNVKRIRPRPLGPFDYSREVNTPSLWISEGVTSYYGELGLVRAGLWSPEHYLDSLSQLLTDFEREPGRRERSIEDTSWDTWFRSNPPGETNLQNTNYSYYDGGEVAGLLLDFTIRHATGNKKSLDDWMRLLYERHALPKPGFLPEEAVRAASDVAGRDMTSFFQKYISGKEPLPYEECLGYAGIRFDRAVNSQGTWLGISVRPNEEGLPLIQSVVPHSPAEDGGLDRGDVIVALNGKAVPLAEFEKARAAHKPGDVLRLTIRRNGQNKDFPILLKSDPRPTITLRPVEKPTPEQKSIYESWLSRK
ncbi:MAG: M61 family metallopeptidase [Acidobacteria bacterium]|nr:M61 family metallopeptidase [Acidobacteriota bacterium]